MTWTDCLFSFIYAFDIFKSPVVLLFNSSKKVPSAFSLMISLSIVLFLMVFFFQSDLFYKKQPISATQTLSTKIRPPIEFNYSNMGFAFIVSDNNNKYYYDPTIFTFVMQYQYYNNTLGTLIKVENKTLQMCQKEDFINHGTYFEDLDLGNVICPSTGNFTLEGFWDETVVKTVNVYLYTCNNDTSKVVCKSANEIDNFFRNKYLNAYYSSNIIDVNNYDKPIQQIYQSDYVSLDTRFSKNMRLNFKKVVVQTDSGLIFPSVYEVDSFVFSNKEIDFVPNNQEWLGNIVLYSSAEIYTVNRRYQKFQDAVAAVGGLANSLLLIGFALTSLEKEFIVFNILMNKLYTFIDPFRNEKSMRRSEFHDHDPDHAEHRTYEMERVETHTFGKNSDPGATIMSPGEINPKTLPPDPFILEHYSSGNIEKKNSHSISPEVEKHGHDKSAVGKIKSLFWMDAVEEQEKRPGQAKLSFKEFMKIKIGMPCWKMTKKERMFSEAYDQYPSEIDLIKIIQKMQEIDKLKYILLNNEQCKLLELLVKPTFCCKSETVSMRGLTLANVAQGEMKGTKGEEKEILVKMQKYYWKVHEDGEKASDIDRRLLKLLEEKSL